MMMINLIKIVEYIKKSLTEAETTIWAKVFSKWLKVF